jgi:peptidoglycan/LPS O-acetylase OafA/YrhL
MRKPELPAITGVRFYAALLVFLSHAPVIPGGEALVGSRLLFNSGVVGVSFFFVLSGFILTYNYGDQFREGVSWATYRTFIWDRWTKIYPVHFAAFLMILPIQIFSPNLPLDWRAVPLHLTLLQCFWPLPYPAFHDTLNVPSWSISCEWLFYLLGPTIMYFAFGKIRRWGLVGMVALYGCVLGELLRNGQTDYSRLYYVSWFAPSRVPEFLVGVFLACMFSSLSLARLERFSGVLQICGILCILAGAIYRPQAPWPLWGGLLYVPGASLLVLGLASGVGAFAPHLSRPWVKQLGMASFSFYLIHAPMLRAVRGVFYHFHLELHTWTEFLLWAGGMYILIQGVALVVYRGYEVPIQKRLRCWLRSSRQASVNKR